MTTTLTAPSVAPLPPHVPPDRVMDVNIYALPGQKLARAEVAIAFEKWRKRIPDFRLAPDADLRCSGGIVGQFNRVILEWDV